MLFVQRRHCFFLYFASDLVAQLVEQRPFKAWVLGSSPSGITIWHGVSKRMWWNR